MTSGDNVLTDRTVDRRGSADEINAAVALHVRALRTGRGWSLDELSGRSSVSKGMLVQIEAARTNPSVATLSRIAYAFGVPVTDLLAPAADRSVHHTVAVDAPVLWRGGRGGAGRLLRSVTEPECVELWDWRLAPHERYDGEAQLPGTRMLVHVLVGAVTLVVDGEPYPVCGGETLDFFADRAYGFRNVEEVPARLVTVVMVPQGVMSERRSRIIAQR